MTRPARPLSGFLCAALIAAGTLVCAPLCAPGWAQPRQLGPPSGTDLEGGDSGPATPAADEDEKPAEKAPPKEMDAAAQAEAAAKAKAAAEVRRRAAADTDILDIPLEQIPNYRGMMREIVEEMSRYARARDPKFVVLTRPGFDLLSWSQREFDLDEIKHNATDKPPPAEAIRQVGVPIRRYRQAIDGFVLNGHFCSALRVPRADLVAARNDGLKAVTIDHCPNEGAVLTALQSAAALGMIAHADTAKDDTFETVGKRRPLPESPANIQALNQAKNVLMLFSAHAFGSRADWLNALGSNNYDMIVIDAFDRTDQPLTKAELYSLKFKQMGSRRLVLARLDIGHADESRFYWQREWQIGNPSWIQAFSAEDPNQYVVEFWNPAWKAIVGKYFAGILDLGFDGVMLDGIEAYRRWEAKTPVALGK